MKKGNGLFVVGAFAGIICIVTLFDVARLDADYSKVSSSTTKSELQTGYDLGLLPPAVFKRRNRNMAVDRRHFDQALEKIMHLSGVPSEKKGKIALRPAANLRLTRSEAVRRMLHALDLLEASGYIRLPASSTGVSDFTDFKVHAGYMRALQYLTRRGVVKGYADGRLRSDKLLTNRECVAFVVRFYQALQVDMQQHRIRSERGRSKSDETDYRNTVSYRRLMSTHKFDPNREVDVQEFAAKIRKKQKRIREILSQHESTVSAGSEAIRKEIKVTSLPPVHAVAISKSEKKADKTRLAPAGNSASRFPYLIRKLEETRSFTKVSESDLL
ncbi:MAG: S-layer homology domain-containing protein [Candidatus Riflebacteria bacterium]|nr:S-layer homology domain-containing protein [Candidatus Riflebacteria bacterium]